MHKFCLFLAAFKMINEFPDGFIVFEGPLVLQNGRTWKILLPRALLSTLRVGLIYLRKGGGEN